MAPIATWNDVTSAAPGLALAVQGSFDAQSHSAYLPSGGHRWSVGAAGMPRIVWWNETSLPRPSTSAQFFVVLRSW
jgi:hypothetical protein